VPRNQGVSACNVDFPVAQVYHPEPEKLPYI
jgi:hypothetical protein